MVQRCIRGRPQEKQPLSLLHFYRTLIALRKTHPALVNGKMELIIAENGILSFERSLAAERIIVLLNLTNESAQITSQGGVILASTGSDRMGNLVAGRIVLNAAEALVVAIPHSLELETT